MACDDRMQRRHPYHHRSPLPSVRSSLKPPPPPTTADSQPPPKETGLDLALSYAHPGAAGI